MLRISRIGTNASDLWPESTKNPSGSIFTISTSSTSPLRKGLGNSTSESNLPIGVSDKSVKVSNFEAN